MVTKLVNKEKGTERLISRIKERLGPIMLKLKHGNLTEDWQESARDQVDDYKVEKSKVIQSQLLNEVCINENWIRQAPNILFFALQRLQYDVKTGRLVKQLGKFHFDKVIYADRMLEANQGRIEGIRQKTGNWQIEIKELRHELGDLNQDPITESLTKTSDYMKVKITEAQKGVKTAVPGQ